MTGNSVARIVAITFCAIVLCLSSCYAQTDHVRWLGICQEISGKWEMRDSKGDWKGLKDLDLVPVEATVRIAPLPERRRSSFQKAGGYLKIAYPDGTNFEVCCADGRSCNPRTDCGELIPIPSPSRPQPTFLELIGDLLLKEPAKYHTPAIGGSRTIGLPQIHFEDGVRVENSDGLLTLAPFITASDRKQHSQGRITIQLSPIDADGHPGKLSVNVVAQNNENGKLVARLEGSLQGLYQMSVYKSEHAGALFPGNAWVLFESRAFHQTATDRYSAFVRDSEPLNQQDPEIASLVRRAFLHRLDQGRPR